MGEVEAAAPRDRPSREADAGLVRGLCERRAEAHAQLYDRYAVGVHRFAMARLGDEQAAEDVVVETMAEVARDIRRFNSGKGSLSAWVLGVARRRVQMEIRRQKRQKAVPATVQVPMDDAAEVSDGADLASRTVARLDAQRKVADLRGLLSDMEMDVLVLSCVEKLSAGEIGQVIGRSERAVHSILHRARTKARERLVGDE